MLHAESKTDIICRIWSKKARQKLIVFSNMTPHSVLNNVNVPFAVVTGLQSSAESNLVCTNHPDLKYYRVKISYIHFFSFSFPFLCCKFIPIGTSTDNIQHS